MKVQCVLVWILTLSLASCKKADFKIEIVNSASHKVEQQVYQYYEVNVVSGYTSNSANDLKIDSFAIQRICQLSSQYDKVCLRFFRESERTSVKKLNRCPSCIDSSNWVTGQESSETDELFLYYYIRNDPNNIDYDNPDIILSDNSCCITKEKVVVN